MAVRHIDNELIIPNAVWQTMTEQEQIDFNKKHPEHPCCGCSCIDCKWGYAGIPDLGIRKHLLKRQKQFRNQLNLKFLCKQKHSH